MGAQPEPDSSPHSMSCGWCDHTDSEPVLFTVHVRRVGELSESFNFGAALVGLNCEWQAETVSRNGRTNLAMPGDRRSAELRTFYTGILRSVCTWRLLCLPAETSKCILQAPLSGQSSAVHLWASERASSWRLYGRIGCHPCMTAERESKGPGTGLKWRTLKPAGHRDWIETSPCLLSLRQQLFN